MSILKFERMTPRNLEQMYKHITDEKKTDKELVFGIGVNPFYAVDEMEFVRKIHHKEYFLHQYVQVIFSFDYDVCTRYDLLAIKEICKKIGFLLLTDKRQIIAAIHYKTTPNVHCHYLINSVGIDGNFYQQKYSVIFYKKRINHVLVKYHLNLIYYYGMDYTKSSI